MVHMNKASVVRAEWERFWVFEVGERQEASHVCSYMTLSFILIMMKIHWKIWRRQWCLLVYILDRLLWLLYGKLTTKGNGKCFKDIQRFSQKGMRWQKWWEVIICKAYFEERASRVCNGLDLKVWEKQSRDWKTVAHRPSTCFYK